MHYLQDHHWKALKCILWYLVGPWIMVFSFAKVNIFIFFGLGDVD